MRVDLAALKGEACTWAEHDSRARTYDEVGIQVVHRASLDAVSKQALHDAPLAKGLEGDEAEERRVVGRMSLALRVATSEFEPQEGQAGEGNVECASVRWSRDLAFWIFLLGFVLSERRLKFVSSTEKCRV